MATPTALVLATNTTSSSDLRYADIIGERLEFPTMYRNQILPGTPFVYYRSREGRDRPPVYFGTGIVGRVRVSEFDPTRLMCEILDYSPFAAPVPFVDAAGFHLEPEGARRGYYQRGCRVISTAIFDRIVREAVPRPATSSESTGASRQAVGRYPTPEHARVVEAVSVQLVAAALPGRHPGARIQVMPHSNPGYDIEVGPTSAIIRYVEVKGTVGPDVHFFMSEGERLFSIAHADRYSLAVVVQVDVVGGTGRIAWYDGAIDDRFELQPMAYEGRWADDGQARS